MEKPYLAKPKKVLEMVLYLLFRPPNTYHTLPKLWPQNHIKYRTVELLHYYAPIT